MSTTREPIDALIEALESQEQHSSQRDSDHQESGDTGLAATTHDNPNYSFDSQEQYYSQDEGGRNTIVTTDFAANNNEHLRTPTSNSPASYSTRCRIARILRTSSLKKRIMKAAHCQFCVRFRFSRLQMETHLNESKLCLSLYLRYMKVNEMDAVLLKIFRCIACSTKGTFQLKRHLGKLFVA